MNTPAHLVVNLALLARGPGRGHGRAIAAGALLPDLPMFFFYAWERFVVGRPELQIWREAYFEAGWQRFIDAFNSLPLALAGLALGLAGRRAGLAALCGSMILHILLDLPLHREDAHAHFRPFSDWRFESPISYWDPAHHGALGALLETVAVLAASVALWRRGAGRAARVALVGLDLLYLGAYATFYLATPRAG